MGHGGYSAPTQLFELHNTMTTAPACPQCAMENTYPDGENYVCADCGHEWPMAAAPEADDSADAVVRDSNGNVLTDGDAVVLIKDLKVKGLLLRTCFLKKRDLRTFQITPP